MQLQTLLIMMTRKTIIVVNTKLIDLNIGLVPTFTKRKAEINKNMLFAMSIKAKEQLIINEVIIPKIVKKHSKNKTSL